MARLLLVRVLFLSAWLIAVPVVWAQAANCGTPVGQNVPEDPTMPVWCANLLPGPDTRIESPNDWIDDWHTGTAATRLIDHDNHNRVFPLPVADPSFFQMGTGVAFDHMFADIKNVTTFSLSGGITVTPDKTFTFENGRFVWEVDVDAGAAVASGANRFVELDVSPSLPTGYTTDALYGYGQFGHAGAMGCRLEGGGNFVCAMYDNTGRVTGGECPPSNAPCTGPNGVPGRVWETQGVGFALVGSSIQGGYPQWPIPGTNLHLSDVWRHCAPTVPYDDCLDRFRMELTKTSIHIYVNGFPAFLIDGLFAVNPNGADSRIPDSWFTSIHPYQTTWLNGSQAPTTRFHWGTLRVMPHLADGSIAPPSASPSFGGSPVPTPTSMPAATSTPTRTATSTPTSVPTATVGPTATPTCFLHAVVNGSETLLPCSTFVRSL